MANIVLKFKKEHDSEECEYFNSCDDFFSHIENLIPNDERPNIFFQTSEKAFMVSMNADNKVRKIGWVFGSGNMKAEMQKCLRGKA